MEMRPKNRAQYASLSYLSSKLSSKRNTTVLFLDDMDDKLKENLIKKVVATASFIVGTKG